LKAAYGLIVRERLRYFRGAISIPAAIREPDEAEIRCQMVNLSEGGMAITSAASLKAGSQVTVEFTIPGEKETEFIAQSEVCWCDEPLPPWIVVRFASGTLMRIVLATRSAEEINTTNMALLVHYGAIRLGQRS